MCPSDTDTLHLVRDLPLKVHSLEPHSDESEAAAAFWKQLATHVQPRHDGGRIDIFADTLAGSVSCVEFVASVEHVADLTTMVTKLEDASATAAAGAAPTASSSSSSSSQKAGSSSEPLPSRFYFNLAKLEVWSLLLPTSRTVVALAKESFEPLLQQVRVSVGDAVAGELVGNLFYGSWDRTILGIRSAVATGLARLHRKSPKNPMLYLGRYFNRKAAQEAARRAHAAGREAPEAADGGGWESDDDQELDMYTGPRVPGLTDNSEIAADARQLSRARLVAGLLGSEANFVDALHVIQSLYAMPMKSAIDEAAQMQRERARQAQMDGEDPAVILAGDPDKRLPSASIWKIMFSAVMKLHEAHKEFLVELKSRVEVWDARSGVVDLMEMFGGVGFDRLESHLDQMDLALQTIETFIQSSKSFRAFIAQCRAQPEGKLQSIHDLFILPIARWRHVYLDFLDKMMPTLTQDHPDAERVHQCISNFERFAGRIATRLGKQAVNERAAMAIDEIVGIPEPLALAKPIFVAKANFRQVELATVQQDFGGPTTTTVKYVQDVTLYLFEKYLVVCNRFDVSAKYGTERSTAAHYDTELPLEVSNVRAMLEIRSHHLMSVRCEDLLLVFEAQDLESIFEWMEAVQAASGRQVKATKDKARTQVRVLSATAPWKEVEVRGDRRRSSSSYE